MRTLGNIIWHIPYLGFIKSLCYAIGGVFWCITIIGIPLGLGLFQLSLFMLAPFSRGLVTRNDLEMLTGEKQDSFIKGWFLVVRILYFPFGLLMAMACISTIIVEFFTLIGIPCGLAEAKALSTIFNPVNKKCVPRAVAEEIERRKASHTLNKYIKVQEPSAAVSVAQGGIQKTETPEPILTDEYLRKAQIKTDEELKIIIQHKDDYNEQLVKAAEKILLSRITGMTSVTQPPIPAFVPDDDRYKAYQPKLATGESQPSYSVASTLSSASVDTQSTELESKKPESKQTESKGMEETESNSNQTILLSILGGALLVIVGILAYFFWYVPYATDRDAPRTYVVATSLFLRSSQVAGVEYNIVSSIPYGSEIITYSKDAEWAKVKVNGQEGFMASPHLINSEDFNLLTGAWIDRYAQECIESTKCRMAILDFYKSNQFKSGTSEWQIHTKMKDQKPNTVFYPRLYNMGSKFTDFVFIIRNSANGNCVLVCYSFDDITEQPLFRFSAGIPANLCIRDMKVVRGRVRVAFDDYSQLDIQI